LLPSHSALPANRPSAWEVILGGAVREGQADAPILVHEAVGQVRQDQGLPGVTEGLGRLGQAQVVHPVGRYEAVGLVKRREGVFRVLSWG